MNDLIQVILLGIIEGITEFLPISSTGHLLIAEHLGLGARSDVFNVVIQLGAILAVVAIYRQRLWQLASGWREPANRDYAYKLAAAFVVTGVLGVAVKKAGLKLPVELGPVALALLIGGFWMLAAEALAARRAPATRISWTGAVVAGLAQIVAAIFPGTSRSAAAIFALMLAGTGERAAATEFVFLLGIPTMFAASAAELHGALKAGAPAENWADLGIAFVVSMVVAFVAVKWLLRYIQTHRFTAFAVYRIVIGATLLFLLPRI